MRDKSGELCILHRTTLKTSQNGQFVMVACRPGCPRYEQKRRR